MPTARSGPARPRPRTVRRHFCCSWPSPPARCSRMCRAAAEIARPAASCCRFRCQPIEPPGHRHTSRAGTPARASARASAGCGRGAADCGCAAPCDPARMPSADDALRGGPAPADERPSRRAVIRVGLSAAGQPATVVWGTGGCRLRVGSPASAPARGRLRTPPAPRPRGRPSWRPRPARPRCCSRPTAQAIGVRPDLAAPLTRLLDDHAAHLRALAALGAAAPTPSATPTSGPTTSPTASPTTGTPSGTRAAPARPAPPRRAADRHRRARPRPRRSAGWPSSSGPRPPPRSRTSPRSTAGPRGCSHRSPPAGPAM